MKRRVITYRLVILGVVLIASGAPYVLRWVTFTPTVVHGVWSSISVPEKQIAMIAAGTGILVAGLLTRK